MWFRFILDDVFYLLQNLGSQLWNHVYRLKIVKNLRRVCGAEDDSTGIWVSGDPSQSKLSYCAPKVCASILVKTCPCTDWVAREKQTCFSDHGEVLDDLNLALALWRLEIQLLSLVVVIILIGFVARAFWNTIIVLK